MKTPRIVLSGLALACLCLCLGSSIASAAVNASITATRRNCTAPCAVFFHADGTTSTGMNGDQAFLFLDYEWSFGDPGSGNWTVGALANTSTPQSKNVEYGPTAGHVFETPGNYVVRLTVCTADGTSCDYETTSIQVANPNTVYAGTATVCVGNARPTAGSGGCPAGAKTVQSSDFDWVWSNAAGCDLDEGSAHVRCLLRRGDTFAASGQVEMSSDRGVQIGAFGSGARPTISASGNFTLFDDHEGWEDWTFMDLRIMASGTSEPAFDLRSWQRKHTHLALIRVAASGWSRFVLATVNGAPDDGSMDLSGLYVSEFDRVTSVGGMSYAFMAGVRDSWLAGMRLGDPANDDRGGDVEQHFMRFQGMQRAFIGHNLIGQGSGNAESIAKIHNMHNGRRSGNASTHSVQFVDNEFLKVGGSGWAVQLGPQTAQSYAADELVERFVIERNWFHGNDYVGDNITSHKVFYFANTRNMMMRNNVVDCSVRSDDVFGICMASKVETRSGSHDSVNTYVLNNTVSSFGPESSTVGLAEIQSSSVNTDVRGNLLYVDRGRSDLFNSASPDVNIGNRDAGSDPFVDGDNTMDPDDTKLAAADTVTAVPGVRRDFAGNLRDSSQFMRGAWGGNGGGGSSGPQTPNVPDLLPPQ